MTPRASSHHGDFTRHLQGWGLSLALHVTAVGSAISLMTGLQAPPIPEPFQWNVSLVQPSPEPTPQQAADAPRQVERRTEPTAPAEEPVERQETASILRQEAPVIEKSETIETPKAVEALVPTPVKTPSEAPVQARVQTLAPVAERQPQPVPPSPEPSPITEAKPAEKIPATVKAPQDAPSRDLTASTQKPLPQSVETERPAPAQVMPSRPSRLETASVQQAPAAAPAAPSPSAQKRDYGWLAEALWKQIEQLKQYPVAARLNRWEGKVVLRAVILDDGNLADLRVAKSSGYEVLDQDALEILRQTAPIKLPQPLGRPQIVIHVPISYQLK